MVAIEDSLFRDLGWNLDCGLAPAPSDDITLTEWRPTTEQMLRWRIVINPESPAPARSAAGVEMENRDDGEREEEPVHECQ